MAGRKVEDEVMSSGAPGRGDVPVWLLSAQEYTPRGDHERFLTRNTLKLTSMLSHMKLQRGGLDDGSLSAVDHLLCRVAPALRLLGLIVTIVCISAASNMFFVYTTLALFLLCIAFKPGEAIIDVLKLPIVALLFTMLIMLPAILIGQPSSFLRVGTKVFITVGLVICQSRSVAYNEMIAGLRTYHVPGLVIFVLDITLKYIVMLGEVATGVLDALTLRSVGHNDDKRSASAGVMGITFLKAHDYSTEMYEAMECRGFTGEYVVPKSRVFSGTSVIYLLGLAGEICYLLLMEGIL